MFNLDDIANKHIEELNKKWPYIPDHPYRGSGSRKTNALLNLVKEQDDVDKIYLYAKDLSDPKYEFLIKKREDVGIKYLNDLTQFRMGGEGGKPPSPPATNFFPVTSANAGISPHNPFAMLV